MVIDGHAHSCGAYNTVEGVGKYLDEHNIDKVILCGGEPNSTKDYAYPMLCKIFKSDKLGYFFNKIICKVVRKNNLAVQIDEGNKKVWSMANKLPNRIMNAYWINPNEEDCIEKMNQFYKDYGFCIIKMHQCWTTFNIEDKNFKEIMKWAKEHHKIIFIHLLNEEQVRRFINIANENEDNVFIIAHMIGISEIEKSLSSRNVYFDLSAPQLYSNNSFKNAISRFGTKRFIAGSDTPYGKNNFDKVRKRLKDIGLNDGDILNICGNNINSIGLIG